MVLPIVVESITNSFGIKTETFLPKCLNSDNHSKYVKYFMFKIVDFDGENRVHHLVIHDILSKEEKTISVLDCLKTTQMRCIFKKWLEENNIFEFENGLAYRWARLQHYATLLNSQDISDKMNFFQWFLCYNFWTRKKQQTLFF